MTFLSRTGLSTERNDGMTWHEYAPCCVADEPGLLLEEKAALTCQTGNWPHNARAWDLLPRWQRAQVQPR
jgi:hypothetical protein